MALDVIYVVRHGVKPKWSVNSQTGKYAPIVDAPTGLPFDPPLTALGREQALELAAHLTALEPPVERFYSSPFYRCLQTIEPTIQALNNCDVHKNEIKVRCESGLSEWYTLSGAKTPSPAESHILAGLFPCLDTDYSSAVSPSVYGEDVDEFHFRIANTVQKLIEQSDREGTRTVLLSTHASALIAIGRVLTGYIPVDIEEEDFKAYPCGVSKFVRRNPHAKEYHSGRASLASSSNTTLGYRAKSLPDHFSSLGNWTCTMDSDSSFLKDQDLTSWKFSRDEPLTDRLFQIS